MSVLEHRQDQALLAAPVLIAVLALHQIPPVVLSSLTCRRLKIHLFVGLLTHVPNPQIAVRAIEGKSPWIAHADRPDLGPRARAIHERVIRRNAHPPRVALHI